VIRVVVFAPVCLYREGLAHILSGSGGIELVGVASEWFEVIGLVRSVRPDVALLDLAAPETMDVVQSLAPEGITKLVALGVRDRENDVIVLAEAGIAGYVTRDGSSRELVATIESVARGEMRCSPRIAAALLERVAELAHAQPDLASVMRLTNRERQIVGLIDLGLSNKQIARELTIELPTVKNHVHNILEKLNVRRRGEAAARMRASRPAVGAR